MRRRGLLSCLVLEGMVAFASGCNRQGRPYATEQAWLREAMRGRRRVELRPAGGFSWAPCRTAPNPKSWLWPAECLDGDAAGLPARPRRHGAGDTGKETTAGDELHFRALGQLLLGTAARSRERAVANLWAALAAQPRDPALLNDLGVAIALRAGEENEPVDLVQALDALSRAITLDRHRPEAWFNQALVEERLHLPLAAARSWRAFLALDGESGWAREAERHLASLRPPPGRQEERRARSQELRLAALRGDAAAVRTATARDRRAARELAIEEALGEWGDDLLRGDPAGAARALQVARAVGAALLELGGDATAADAVGIIDGANGGGLRALAEGHRAFRDARRLISAYRVEPALPLLRRAADRLARGASPVAAWAGVDLASAHVALGRYRQADAEWRTLLVRADARRYPSLCGRICWGLGWSLSRQGRLGPAHESYQRAVPFFTAAGEALNLADVQARTAEILNRLGEPALGWRHRYAALRETAGTLDTDRLYYLLEDAALAAEEDGEPAAALCFQTEALEVARSGGQPLRLAEALVSRARIALALGRPEAASADLRQARRACGAGEPGTTREGIEGDLVFFEGEARRAVDPAAAIALLTRSLELYRRKALSLSLPRAYLGRARAELALNRDQDAEADLAAAAAVVAEQAKAIGDRALRLSFADTVQDLFDSMILYQADRRRDPLAALNASERARNLATAGPPPRSREPGREARPAASEKTRAAAGPGGVPWLGSIPAGVTILEYALVRDELLCWTIQARGVSLVRRPDAAALEPLLNSWLGGMRDPDAETETGRLAESLYRRLVPATLERAETLVIVPDKALNAVPFAALRNPASGRYLIEEHAIAVAPSARSFLATLDRPPAPPVTRWKALLVGNPDFDRRQMSWLPELPGAAVETAAIGKLYDGATVLTGRQPTVSRVLDELSRHELVNYAGHAVANLRDPAHSYLALAPSPGRADPGMLFAWQIGWQRLPRLRLVVLSACGTLSAAARRNGGLSGLARPFLDAGAAAVLGTLWNVEDRASAGLLVEFHRRLRAGATASTALRSAQLSLLRGPDGELRAPGAWASFELLGDFVPNSIPPERSTR
jgi:tetratricopeptide (TPR) repeat protein